MNTPRIGLRIPDAINNFSRLNDWSANFTALDDAARYNEDEEISGNWKHTGTEQHGDDSNNMKTEADGFVTLTGTARAVMDIVFTTVRLKKGGISDPAEVVVGISYLLAFDDSSDEEVFVKAEIPHHYASGTDIKAHFHWAPSDAAAGNVTWGIEYHITRPNNSEVLTEATTTAVVVDATDTLQDESLKSGDITISGSGVVDSDFIHIRVFRDADASEGGASDTYGSDANLISFDLEIMVNGFGEDEQW